MIETERLQINLFSLNDAEFLLELYNAPNFIRFIGDRNLKTTEDAASYISNKFFPQIERLGFGNFLITLKETNEKVGSIGIFEREGLETMDIGFSFLPAHEGKGYGYEASTALIAYAKEHFGVKRLSAITLPNNISSIKLIEKLGFEYLRMVKLPHDPEELMYFEKEV